MPRQIVFTPNAAKPPASYSQAVKAAGLVFVSGTAPHDPTTGAIIGTTIQEQVRQSLTNISAILEAAGTSLDRVVSATIVLADEDDLGGHERGVAAVVSGEPAGASGRQTPGAHPGTQGLDRGHR